MFAIEHSGVTPDVVVMAKGIASGFPMAAIGAPASLMARWPAGAHGGTYGGNPMGCAAALATLDVIADEHLVEHAAARGARLVEGLRRLQSEHPGLADVRGLGLMVGCELRDASGAPDAARTDAVLAHCRDQGRVLLMSCGTDSNVVRWIPPLVVDDAQIDQGLAAFAAALAATA
jgi:4-aminobutyrate aminotransferase-like enzyme